MLNDRGSERKMVWLKNTLIGAGIFLVVGSHIFVQTVGVKAEMLTAHSVVNYVGAGLVAVGTWLVE